MRTLLLRIKLVSNKGNHFWGEVRDRKERVRENSASWTFSVKEKLESVLRWIRAVVNMTQ